MAGRISSKMKAKRAGKANSDKASDKSEEEFDTSILSKPLETSISNIAKLLKLYQTTTDEVFYFSHTLHHVHHIDNNQPPILDPWIFSKGM